MRYALTTCLAALASALIASSAWSLPPGRQYEMVSPVFKGGYGASEIAGVAPDGNAVIFATLIGAYAGSNSPALAQYYRAARSSSGGLGAWSSQSLNLPAEVAPVANLIGFSVSTETSAWAAVLGHFNVGSSAAEETEWQLMAREASGIQPLGPVLRSRAAPQFVPVAGGASDDLCHVIVHTDLPLTEEYVTIATEADQPYDVNRGCDGSVPTVRGVALDNSGAPLSPDCRVAVPYEGERNAVSSDGEVIFFEAESPNKSCSPINRHLYTRIGASKTLEVAQPLKEECKQAPCPGAASRPGDVFDGASQDGSRVFFTTAAPLEPATDHNATADLYMATIGCATGVTGCEAGQRQITSMTQISKTLSGTEESGIREVGPISPDGSHVYFVARGILTDEGPTTPGAQSLPTAGAENLYLYEQDARYPAGRMVFVSDLCSGPESSGNATDQRCPADLKAGENGRNDDSFASVAAPVQAVGPSGDMLVFSTFAQVIDSGPEADTDDAEDVYRFDVESRSMVRVSVGENDYHANGNGEDATKEGQIGKSADASIQPSRRAEGRADEERQVLTQAASEDGSRIVFSTAEPLSPHAINHQTDIYEWHLGAVSLISSGRSTSPDSDPVITPSGQDVFFVTDQSLRPQDTDTARDVYDARLGGGEATAPLQAEACSPATCKGPLAIPAPLLAPGSLIQPAEEGSPTPTEATKPAATAKKKPKPKPKKKKPKRSKKGSARRAAHRARHSAVRREGGHK